MYKINIHTHTIFSDGANTPYVMAQKAKELGFSALVITDHLYKEANTWFSLNLDRLGTLKRACIEAEKIMPVILGVELAIGNEEILVFGKDAVYALVQNNSRGGVNDISTLLRIKGEFNSAFILCHPFMEENWEEILPVLDGFEAYNSGNNMFKDREYGCLGHLPRWSNSDAHMAKHLGRGYNLVEDCIETEEDLISYIKSGKQPKMFTEQNTTCE
jgi:predicted metal-dependent phosphoesterase TrpH